MGQIVTVKSKAREVRVLRMTVKKKVRRLNSQVKHLFLRARMRVAVRMAEVARERIHHHTSTEDRENPGPLSEQGAQPDPTTDRANPF